MNQHRHELRIERKKRWRGKITLIKTKTKLKKSREEAAYIHLTKLTATIKSSYNNKKILKTALTK